MLTQRQWENLSLNGKWGNSGWYMMRTRECGVPYGYVLNMRKIGHLSVMENMASSNEGSLTIVG